MAVSTQKTYFTPKKEKIHRIFTRRIHLYTRSKDRTKILDKDWTSSHISVPWKTQKTVVYGAVSYEKKGRHFFKQYEKFNGPNFVSYLKESERKFGKIAVMVCKAPQHRSKDVKELLRENKNIRLIYLPTGSPEPNMVRGYWAMVKRKLLVSEYYPTLENMMMEISEYFRTLRCKISPEKFLYRKILEHTGTNL